MKIRYILLSAFLFGSLIQSFAQQSYSFIHNNQNREYTLYFPNHLPDHAPLVIMLHGYWSTADQIMSYSGMNLVADENKFVVCYPQGTQDRNGANHWNARLGLSETDDVGFLTELAVYLQDEYGLDPQRTFVCGHSNGGFMSYTLACEAPGVFKAIASMAGTLSGYTWENRSMAQPIPVLQIHGIDDQTVPIDGSMAAKGWGGAPHMDTVIRFWAELNDCKAAGHLFYPNLTHAYYYTNGINKNEVWYYKISDWGHSWPSIYNATYTGTIASEVIWEFFSAISMKTLSAQGVINDFNVSTFPNPFTSWLNILNPSSEQLTYALLSIEGKVVMSGQSHETSFVLSTAFLPAGIYLLKTNRGVKKVIKTANR